MAAHHISTSNQGHATGNAPRAANPTAPAAASGPTEGLASTGITGLDEILLGGLPRNRLYLLQGDPGVGKTTMALQFLLDGRDKGERVQYITLSETREEIETVARSHGWSMEGIHVYELANAGDFASSDNTLFHPDELELHETTRTILGEVERVAPNRIVFDSLSEVRLLSQSTLRYRRQILALKQYFAGRGCTVLLLDDRTGEPGGDSHLQSLTHGVIGMEHRAPEYGRDRRRLRIIKLRGINYRGGYHDFNIETGGIRVFPRLVVQDHDARASQPELASGVLALDTMLGGGLQRGTATLLMGAAGAGKSAMATQYILAAAKRGETTAMYLFDERKPTLYSRARTLGQDLESGVDAGRVRIRQIDPAELSPGEFVSEVRRAVLEDGVKLVVIDSINGYLQAMPEERFLAIQMHELLSFLSQHGVTTIMTLAQHGIMGAAMQVPVDMSYLADTVVILRFFESEGHIRKAVSVLKKRSGPHETSIREYSLGAGGISIGEPLREFQGILTGVPVYRGDQTVLMHPRGAR